MPNVKINTGNTVGLVRRLDELGRIVLPIEYRKKLKMKEKEEVEIYLLKNGIYIGKINNEEEI